MKFEVQKDWILPEPAWVWGWPDVALGIGYLALTYFLVYILKEVL